MLIKRFSTLKAFIETPHGRGELAGKAGPAEELRPPKLGACGQRFAIKDGFKGRQEGSARPKRWKRGEIQQGYPWKPWISCLQLSEEPVLRNKAAATAWLHPGASQVWNSRFVPEGWAWGQRCLPAGLGAVTRWGRANRDLHHSSAFHTLS